MYKRLETERLIIRPIALDDASFIFELVNSEGWLRFIGDRNVKTQAESEQYIQKLLANKALFYNVFVLKPSHQPIGIISFLLREDYSYPDIGFAMLPQFGKKGYALEAARKYLDEIVAQSSMDRVLGITMPENTDSIRLLERLGLKFSMRLAKDKKELLLYELIIRQ